MNGLTSSRRGPSPEDATAIAGELRGLRLLVVDDEPFNRDLVRHILEPFGVLVTDAKDGSEAVGAARSELFDLILMDIRLPQIDGPTAAKLIRSPTGLNASTPIVAFTAEPPGYAPPSWRSVFDASLTKPIVAADLLQMLAAQVPQRRRSALS